VVRNKKRTTAAINRAKRLWQRQQRWMVLGAMFEKPFDQRTPEEIAITRYGLYSAIREFFFNGVAA